MRILILGRPPGADWRFPPSTNVVVCGEDLASNPWYQAVPVPDLSDLEQVLYALTHAGQLQFDAVYCDYEYALVNASLIATAVGASIALPLRLALLSRDKLAQKTLVASAGVSTAAAEMVPLDTAARETFRCSLEFPIVIKPVFGSGGRDVRLLDTHAAAAVAIAAIGRHEPVLCETFVTGREYHIDAVIADGELALLSVGLYLTNVINVDLAHPRGSCIVPAVGHDALYERAETLLLLCREAFGLTDGVMHLEAFDSDGVLVYSECAFRRAGGKISDAVALATGSDYRQASCMASLSLLSTDSVIRPRRAIAWVIAGLGPGRLRSMPDDRRFASINGLEQLSLRHDLVGRDVDEVSGRNAGFIIVSGSDVAAVCGEINRAAAILREEVVLTPASLMPGSMFRSSQASSPRAPSTGSASDR